MLGIERDILLSSVLQHLEWRLVWSKQRLGSLSTIDQPLLQLRPCLSLPLFSFVTSSVTFLLDVAAVRRQRVSMLLIEGWRSLPAVALERAVIPQKAEARARLAAGAGLITDRA